LLGTELRLKFKTAKLTAYHAQWEELEQGTNPFAVVVQAHLIALQTRHDTRERMRQRLTLAKRLYQRGFNKPQIIGLFRFLDWVLTLPEDLATEYDQKLTEFEEEQKMEYVTTTERRGIKIGHKMGVVETAVRLLQWRWMRLRNHTSTHCPWNKCKNSRSPC
jgi:hypothetical protein